MAAPAVAVVAAVVALFNGMPLSQLQAAGNAVPGRDVLIGRINIMKISYRFLFALHAFVGIGAIAILFELSLFPTNLVKNLYKNLSR